MSKDILTTTKTNTSEYCQRVKDSRHQSSVMSMFYMDCMDFQSFLPHETQRWGKLRDQMLHQHLDLQKYLKKVNVIKENQLPSWSEDEAFTSYLLDCLEDDLAHGNEVKLVQCEDTTAEDVELQRVFRNEAGRWGTLRDRMLNLPYFDRYVYRNPDWSQDELFSCCLLDRLEEQLEKSVSPVNRWMHAAVIEGANDKEDNNEEELESLGDEDGEEDNLGLGDDFSDPDFDPEEESVSDDSVRGKWLSSSDSEEDFDSDGGEKDNKLKKTAYRCKICNEELQYYDDVIQHFVVHHGGQKSGAKKIILKAQLLTVKDVATMLLKCKDCEKFVEKLAEHRKESHCNCQVCGKKLTTPHKLHLHMAKHSQLESEGKTLLCDHCGKLFFNRVSLVRHIRGHLGIRTEKCDICSKLFTDKNKLIIHKGIHLPEKPHACTYCGRRFTQRYNMLKHTRIHTGVKPYSCDLCEESFNHNISLKNHKKKKHGIDWWNKDVLPVVTLPDSSQQSKSKPKARSKSKSIKRK